MASTLNQDILYHMDVVPDDSTKSMSKTLPKYASRSANAESLQSSINLT